MKEQEKIKRKYFWLVIIGAGSSGIWLMFLVGLINGIEDSFYKSVPSNLSTYFLGILITGCIDKGLTLFEGSTSRSKSEFLNIIIVISVTFLLLLFTILTSLKNMHWWAFAISVIGVILALIIWWNINIRSISRPTISILGGPADKELKDE